MPKTLRDKWVLGVFMFIFIHQDGSNIDNYNNRKLN